MNFIQKAYYEIADDLNLFEMANVRPDKTGLRMVIYISPRNGSKHGPRIKVSQQYGEKTSSDFFTVTIADNPVFSGKYGNIKGGDIDRVREFIQLNKDILLQLWYDKIDPFDAVSQFKKV